MEWFSDAARAYAALLSESLFRLTGRAIPADAEQLFEYALPLVSHGTQADPIFRYANRAALDLWGMDWASFTALPSRLSAEAEPDIQGDRQALLQKALQQGFVSDYSGIRISANGQRFRIAQTVLWNVTDRDGQRHGQAALIGSVEPYRAPLA
ncbi:MEKHLA domain-containing protein [Neogemmobacter tilapiae]|uniref:MEKHLA domain-containing protein n=1 Tax=Neogemmobacter tilapiae TaxID=875041 RepID=A0A918TU53_9RHOB|nr:MEKHLA domain-containing protein [Gemmobacter tilapiae]GHC63597.1 MEKHLA domain-containing protein [Gemmobacter tilapiae]